MIYRAGTENNVNLSSTANPGNIHFQEGFLELRVPALRAKAKARDAPLGMALI